MGGIAFTEVSDKTRTFHSFYLDKAESKHMKMFQTFPFKVTLLAYFLMFNYVEGAIKSVPEVRNVLVKIVSPANFQEVRNILFNFYGT